jgi:hypothetical protein
MRPDPYRTGFSFTAGVLTAVAIFVALTAVAYFGWEEYRKAEARQLLRELRQAVDRDVDRPGAIRAATKVLSRVGYGPPSNDTEVTLSEDEGTHLVGGHCEKGGTRHKFFLWFDKRPKGSAVEWRVVRLMIDGKTL